MKTAMQMALDRIEMLYIEKDSIHWEMFKNDCMEKEKVQIKRAFEFGIANAYNFIEDDAEQYYNQTYSQDRELGKEVTDLLENYKKYKNKL